MGIDAGSSFVDNAMRDVSAVSHDLEQEQELLPADSPRTD